MATPKALLQLARFAQKHSHFFKNLYQDVDLTNDVTSLQGVPVIDHSAYWDHNGIMASGVMTGPQMDGVIMRTGGTTSRPKFVAYSQIELQRTASLLAGGLLRAGVRPGDLIGNLFYAGDCYGSFLLHILSVAAAPLPLVQVPIGGLTSPDSIEQLVDQCGVTVLLAPVTTLFKVAEQRILNQKTFDGIHLVMFGGEPLFPDQRTKLQDAFPNARFRSCIYGSIDAGVVAESVDDADARLHQVSSGIIAEIFPDDPEGNRPITENNVEGSLVVTNLIRLLTPVIRYPTGDRAKWVDIDAGIFRLMGRDNHAVRVGPVSLDMRDLRRIVGEALALPVLAVQAVILRRDCKDMLRCQVDAKPPDERAAEASIRQALHHDRPMFAQHVEHGQIGDIEVKFVPVSDMVVQQTTGKLLEVVDLRCTAANTVSEAP